MKKLVSIMLSLVMLVSITAGIDFSVQAAVWNGSAASSFAGGNGTSSKPYLISNAEQLARMKNLVNSKNSDSSYRKAYYKLTADITLNDTSDWTSWSSKAPKNKWTPIGNYNSTIYTFDGVFDGNNHTISGIYINSTGNYMGLFGLTYDATIKNLKIAKSYIAGYNNVGAIAGRMSQLDKTSIFNCSSSATVVGKKLSDDKLSSYTGGIVGSSSGNIYKCTNSGKVTGYYSVGGVVGSFNPTYNSLTFNTCTNSGAVTGMSAVGGVAGDYSICDRTATTLSSLKNSGKVTSDTRNAGGIIGNLYATGTNLTLTKSQNTGNVTAASGQSGGIIGHISKSNCTVKLNLLKNTGNISGSYEVGGILGDASASGTGVFNIENCSSSGNISFAGISSYGSFGGIVGYMTTYEGTTNIKNCFNSGDISNTSQGSSNGGIVGQIYANPDDSKTAVINVQSCMNAGSISAANYYSFVSGRIGVYNKGATVNICDCRYLSSSENPYRYISSSGGTINNNNNSSTSSYNLMDEAYLGDYGYFVCMWSFAEDSYPCANLNGSHQYVVTKTVKASTTDKKNGKIYKTCDVCGLSTTTSVAYAKSLSLSPEKSSYYGSGSYAPTITVKNSSGSVIGSSNYTVSYKNLSTNKTGTPKSIGKYTVTVTMKGNYTGKLTKTYYVNPAYVSFKSAKSTSKKTANLAWYTDKYVSGYQIQYSTKSNFSNAKSVYVSGAKTSSKKITKLSSNKKYYFRIRGYKTVKINGKATKLYSTSWSSTKSVTIK